MKKKLISVAVGCAFMALGFQVVYADELERDLAKESQTGFHKDLNENNEENRLNVTIHTFNDVDHVSDARSTYAAGVQDPIEPRTIAEGVAGRNSIAIGNGSSAQHEETIAIGHNAIVRRFQQTSAGGAIAIGKSALAVDTGAIGFGQDANANAMHSIAIGDKAKSSSVYGVAIGAGAVANAYHSVALGSNSVDDNRQYVVSVGSSQKQRQIINVAVGTKQADAVNFGQLAGMLDGQAKVDANGNVSAPSYVIGGKTYTNVKDALVAAAASDGESGSPHAVQYDDARHGKLTLGGTSATTPVTLTNIANGAIGAASTDAVNGSQLHGTAQSVATTIGGGTTIGMDGKLTSTSIEVNGTRYDTVEGAIKAAAKSGATDSMAVKYDDDRHTRVTLGGTGALAPIVLTNVANGVNQHDAVNFGQLSKLANKVEHVDGRVTALEKKPGGVSNGPGNSNVSGTHWDLKAGGEKITHVGNATEMGDAVNLGQMNDAIQARVGLAAGTTAKDYTDQQIQGVRGQVNDVSRNAYSGIAAATALTMIPGVDPGKTLSFGIGGAAYKGYQAVALGGEARITQNLKVKGGVGLSSGGNTVGMGASYQW